MENLIENMILLILSDKGFTLDINGETPESGYMVAINKENEKIVLDYGSTGICTMKQILKDYVQDNIVLLNTDGNYLGAWEYRGDLYLDISKRCESVEAAFNQAKRLDQLAIWDLSNSIEIEVK